MTKDKNFNLRKHVKKEVKEKEHGDKEWKVDDYLEGTFGNQPSFIECALSAFKMCRGKE